MAKDIADGFVNITAANLRKYTDEELRTLMNSMRIVQREVRMVVPDEADFDAIKKKNWRLQNLSRTQLIINTYAKRRRISL